MKKLQTDRNNNPASMSWSGSLNRFNTKNNSHEEDNYEDNANNNNTGHRMQAWNGADHQELVEEFDEARDLTYTMTVSAPIEPDGPYASLAAGDTAVAIGLMRIGEILTRKIIPWQGANCPRAVESLRDARLVHFFGSMLFVQSIVRIQFDV